MEVFKTSMLFVSLLGSFHLTNGFPNLDHDYDPTAEEIRKLLSEIPVQSDAFRAAKRVQPAGFPSLDNGYNTEAEDILKLLSDGSADYNPPACSLSEFGCCNDGKSKALGPGREGCDIILCTDKRVGSCFDKKQKGTLNCEGQDAINCKFSCKTECRAAAAPIKSCLRNRPAHGCCWDGKIALKRDGSDCRRCENVYRNVCNIFSSYSGGCNSGSWGIRNFMINYCPVTCDFCKLAINGGLK